jgi:antitoxin component YwqK of YwqJK toxin-antitoxin module
MKYSYHLLVILIACFFATTSCSSQSYPKKIQNVSSDSSEINQMRAGQKMGLWKTFYANGQPKNEGYYAAGLKEGVHKAWEQDGTFSEEAEFTAGKQTGETRWYHPQGHLAASGQMVDGVREGPWVICDIEENGFCIDAFFKNGKRSGVWKIYHDVDHKKLWKEQTFENDRVVSERCWDEYGILVTCIESAPR